MSSPFGSNGSPFVRTSASNDDHGTPAYLSPISLPTSTGKAQQNDGQSNPRTPSPANFRIRKRTSGSIGGPSSSRAISATTRRVSAPGHVRVQYQPPDKGGSGSDTEGEGPAQTPQRSAPKRPSDPTRSAASSPAVLQQPKTRKEFRKQKPYELDDELAQIIRRPRKAADKKAVGRNYVSRIVRPDDKSIIVKVGKAKDTAMTRKEDIQRKCNHSDWETLNANQRSIREYKIAEDLIKAELHNFRYAFECGCKTKHTEYFKIDPKVALEATKRWNAFCGTKPWDEHGVLSSFWTKRLDDRILCGDGEREDDHAARAKRWQDFTNVSNWDRAVHNTICIVSTVRRLFWQIVAILQACYVAYMAPNAMQFGWLVFLLAAVVLQIASKYMTPLSKPPKARSSPSPTTNFNATPSKARTHEAVAEELPQEMLLDDDESSTDEDDSVAEIPPPLGTYRC